MVVRDTNNPLHLKEIGTYHNTIRKMGLLAEGGAKNRGVAISRTHSHISLRVFELVGSKSILKPFQQNSLLTRICKRAKPCHSRKAWLSLPKPVHAKETMKLHDEMDNMGFSKLLKTKPF